MSDDNEGSGGAAPYVPSVETVTMFQKGLVVRVMQPFKDYDGQMVQEGEVLHFLDSNYFPYEGGVTLNFEEKTIRIAFDSGHGAIIENRGNSWFQPVDAG